LLHKGIKSRQFLTYTEFEVTDVLLFLSISLYRYPSGGCIGGYGMSGMIDLRGSLGVGSVAVFTASFGWIGAETEGENRLCPAVLAVLKSFSWSWPNPLLLPTRHRDVGSLGVQVREETHFAEGNGWKHTGTGELGLSRETEGALACFHLLSALRLKAPCGLREFFLKSIDNTVLAPTLLVFPNSLGLVLCGGLQKDLSQVAPYFLCIR